MLEKIISIFGIIFATLKRNWKEMGQVSLWSRRFEQKSVQKSIIKGGPLCLEEVLPF
jgi:hypothetical protein